MIVGAKLAPYNDEAAERPVRAMRYRNTVERVIGGGVAEVVAGAVVILVSLTIYPGIHLKNLALQAVVFSTIIILRFFPALAVLPLLMASVLWSVRLADHMMLCGFLVYLAVEYAVARGRALIAAMLAVEWLAFAYLVTRDMSLSVDDLPGVAVELLFLAAAVAVGYFRASATREQQRRQAAQQQLQHNLRTSIARYLHDSLARTLTMMSMQAELARINAVDPDIQRQLDSIADSGRFAIEDLRQLVTHLVHIQPDATETMLGSWNTATVGNSIASAANMLSEAGYNLRCTGIDPDRRLPRCAETAFTLAFNEVTANLIKHAPSRANVDISVIEDEQYLNIRIINSCTPKPHTDLGEGVGIGLGSITARMHTIGGHASFTTTPEQWQVTLSVPVAEETEINS